MSTKALIFGCAGLELTDEEIRFFRAERPWGFILFGRNIDNPDQVRKLTEQLRQCIGRAEAPVLIDEEGGRVQRLRPPHWPNNPPGRVLGKIYEQDSAAGKRAARIFARLIAHDLVEIGINVDCLPILDVTIDGVSDAIGDRAYSQDADTVCQIGAEVINGLQSGGVLPVIKHMPGHGRALCDSHHELPVVDADFETLKTSDFIPFKALNGALMAMTAHIVFKKIDPARAATVSATIVEKIIRQHIGFAGLLMSDDLSMHALSGDYRQRAQSCFDAGLDIVLHCNGEMDQMREVATVAPSVEGVTKLRADNALSAIGTVEQIDVAAMRREFDELAKPFL